MVCLHPGTENQTQILTEGKLVLYKIPTMFLTRTVDWHIPRIHLINGSILVNSIEYAFSYLAEVWNENQEWLLTLAQSDMLDLPLLGYVHAES
jgi:hypothetical protein